jgi:hypothetical protein
MASTTAQPLFNRLVAAPGEGLTRARAVAVD